MHEFNDGLRPNYDFAFDEAIERTFDGKDLKPHHEIALKRHTIQACEKPLATNQVFVIPQ